MISSRDIPDLLPPSAFTISWSTWRGRLEQRGEKPAEFVPHFVRSSEEEPVDVLCGALSFLKQAPVVGDPAKYHVALHDLPTVEAEVLVVGVGFAFFQREGAKRYLSGYAVVQSAARPQDLVDDPCRGRSADYEQYVPA